MQWLEEARINALYKVGLSYKDLTDDGYELPVVDLQIRYMKPIFHGDKVVLASWVLPGKGPRWRWKTKFLKDSGNLAALANIDLVLINSKNSVNSLLSKVPPKIVKAFSDLRRGPSS